MTQLNPRDVTPAGNQPENIKKPTGHDLAVIAIGVDSYPEAPDVTTLSCAANDAEAVYALFNTRRTNSSSTLLVNQDATVEAIKSALVEAAGSLGESGTLLVTFSGHGAPLFDGDRAQAAFFTTGFTGYSEAEFGTVRDGVFTLRDVKEWLNEAEVKPQNLILVMDSCGSGASITGAARKSSASLDGRKAVPRAVRLRAELDADGKRLATFPVDLAPDDVPWPTGSCVFALSAATAGGSAYEIPELGHGVLSLLVLEWLNQEFLANPDGSDDIGRDLFKYVSSQILRLSDGQDLIGPALQKPDRKSQSTVTVRHNGAIIRTPVAHNLLAIGRQMPVPRPYADDSAPEGREFLEQFQRNAESIARRVARPVSGEVGDTNFVVSIPRFYGTRSLLQRVATHLTQEADVNYPVLYLGLGRIRKILPLIGSLESAFDMMPGRQTNVAAGPPIVTAPNEALIDNFIDRLCAGRACVIAPFRDQEADHLMKYFLRRCAQESRITLLIALYAGEPIPEWITYTHYRQLERTGGQPDQDSVEFRNREKFRQRFESLQTNASIDSIPEDYLNLSVLSWLSRLKDRESNSELWQINFGRYAFPYYQSRNSARAVLNVLEQLLPVLGQESQDALELLKAMSVVSLPRSRRLVENLWIELIAWRRGEPIVENADDAVRRDLNRRMDAALKILLDWRLVRESDRESEKDSLECPLHFFVHSLIREAAREHELREKRNASTSWPTAWSRIGGRAYATSLDDPATLHWWPRPILAHESIRHLLDADDDEHACRTLLKHWRMLVDAGYHEIMLEWSQRLYTGIVSTGLKEQAERDSLQLVIPLLVNLQTLHKHRQDWYVIQGLHAEVEERIKDYRTLSEGRLPTDAGDAVEKVWIESRQNLANYNFINKNFDEARDQYEKCYDWARKNGQTSMECSNLIRLANCDVLTGSFDAADDRLKEIADRLNEIATTDSEVYRRQSRHLRSVRIESARIRERREELYDLSLQAWTQALQSYGQSRYQERFDLAIANVHMAWACLSRGEFLRAWRHSLQARRLLNDRGIPELWWYGETERIAALAIAFMFREPPDVKEYEPWSARKPGSPSSAKFQFTESVLQEQKRVLEELIKVCRPKNPWRAAELMSALGQFVRYAIQDEQEGPAWLHEAQKLARSRRHTFLEIRTLEAIGVEALYRGDVATAAKWLQDCATKACAYGLDDRTGRYSKNGEVVAALAKQKREARKRRPEPNKE